MRDDSTKAAAGSSTKTAFNSRVNFADAPSSKTILLMGKLLHRSTCMVVKSFTVLKVILFEPLMVFVAGSIRTSR